MAYWAQVIQTLPQPLQAWLKSSYLTPPTNNISILFVDLETYLIINKDIFYLSKIYPAVKAVYSDLSSVFVLPQNYFNSYIKDNTIVFSHYERP